MQSLFSEKDLQDLNSRIRRRFIVIGAVMALFLAAAVWSFLRRIEWLTVASVVLCGAAAIFGIDLFCLPLIRYRRLVSSALTGRTHTETFEYGGTESELSMVDGISCRSIIVLGSADKHGSREQRFYWDAEHPLPAFEAGRPLTLTYTGRFVVAYGT